MQQIRVSKMAKNNNGICHLCGKNGELSFEHIPPKKAFNNCPVSFYDYFMGKTDGNYNIQHSPKGLGEYTLCQTCNNYTGGCYGAAFIDWAKQSMDTLQYTQNNPSLFYRFRIYPLRVIKQIVTIMFSVNDKQFSKDHQELVKFVLNKDQSHLNPDTKVYAFYTAGGFRMSGGMGKIETNDFSLESLAEKVNGLRTKIETHRIFSEFAFPPLGYVLAFEREKPDNRLIDISGFASYRYSDKDTIELRLPVLPVDSPYPTDYRTRKQMEQDRAQNRQ